MRVKGRISHWNDDKGYGFISSSPADKQRLFVHIKAFAKHGRRPTVGDVVSYTSTTDSRGRACANDVVIAGQRDTLSAKTRADALPQIVAIVFLLLVGGAVAVSAIPSPILVLYAAASIATFASYALDERAAAKGTWRTSENTLHLLALVGGWPGALIARHRLRHKTRKQPFRAIFWMTVIANCTAFGFLFTIHGANAWQSLIVMLT